GVGLLTERVQVRRKTAQLKRLVEGPVKLRVEPALRVYGHAQLGPEVGAGRLEVPGERLAGRGDIAVDVLHPRVIGPVAQGEDALLQLERVELLVQRLDPG